MDAVFFRPGRQALAAAIQRQTAGAGSAAHGVADTLGPSGLVSRKPDIGFFAEGSQAGDAYAERFGGFDAGNSHRDKTGHHFPDRFVEFINDCRLPIED